MGQLSITDTKQLKTIINYLDNAGVPDEILDKMTDIVDRNEFTEPSIKTGWDIYDIEGIINNVIELSKIKSWHDQAKEEVEYFDKEAQDLLHGVELLEKDLIPEDFDFIRKIHENRVNRRKAKDFVILTDKVSEFVSENTKIFAKLDDIKGNYKYLKQKLQNERLYHPRVVRELEEPFDTLAAAKN